MKFDTFDEAKAVADAEGLIVCGGYNGPKPFYFLMPDDAADTSIRDTAFELREGRDMTDEERRMISLVKEVRPEALEVTPDAGHG